ncbi:aquaporin-like protein [Daldinia vernicosa]|uniref:aquaporin-like protein n=1 Tax=Daldinia vernicosa TaxID=114800 RepID=UPI002008265E|nr:aquaporin-like protein [Daldinia vernicosa]KAI0847451.1 aquaporin-like protein [Daldinia vernicosa]
MPSGQRSLGGRLRPYSNPQQLFNRFSNDDNETDEYGCDRLNRQRQRLGLDGNCTTSPGDTHPENFVWSRIRLMLREPLLEFWGCFIMVLMGNSVLAQTYLSNQEYGSWINICFGWACGAAFGIYVAGDSGAYLNPAVTLTNCLFRGLPLRRFPTYAAAQLLGMFCAAGVVYANYISAFDNYEGRGIRTIPPSKTSSAKIFCTFPASFVPKASQFFSEYIANFVVMFCIFAMRDENGAHLKGGGWSPINPARDFTGRIWLTILGYDGAWSAFDVYSWIPVVVPFIATISGAIAYDLFIYTGDSPINSYGLGPNNIFSKICGKPKKRQVDEEENRGADEFEDNDRLRPAEERGRIEGSQGGSRTQSITNKDTGYDMPQDGDPGSMAGFSGSNIELQNKTSKNKSYGNT